MKSDKNKKFKSNYFNENQMKFPFCFNEEKLFSKKEFSEKYW